MSEAAVLSITPGGGPSLALPSYDDLRSHIGYWVRAAYLGIGELSLTWPVAAFLRGL